MSWWKNEIRIWYSFFQIVSFAFFLHEFLKRGNFNFSIFILSAELLFLSVGSSCMLLTSSSREEVIIWQEETGREFRLYVRKTSTQWVTLWNTLPRKIEVSKAQTVTEPSVRKCNVETVFCITQNKGTTTSDTTISGNSEYLKQNPRSRKHFCQHLVFFGLSIWLVLSLTVKLLFKGFCFS